MANSDHKSIHVGHVLLTEELEVPGLIRHSGTESSNMKRQKRLNSKTSGIAMTFYAQ